MPGTKRSTLSTAKFGSSSKRRQNHMAKMRAARNLCKQSSDELGEICEPVDRESGSAHVARPLFAENVETCRPPPTSSSAKKIEAVKDYNERTDNFLEQDIFGQREWCLIEIGQLNRLLCDIVCPMCENAPVQVSLGEKKGLSRKMKLACQSCVYSNVDYTSPKNFYGDRGDQPFDVNQRAVLYTVDIGMGFAALNKFCAIFGMPNMTETTYERIHKHACTASTDSCGLLLNSCRSIFKNTYDELYPLALPDPDVPLPDDGWDIDDGVRWIDVSFDGSWQRHGHVSHYGVGIVIDVVTGYALDWHVLSTYCHKCALNEKHMTDAERIVWMDAHEEECQRNHHASAKAMEREAALELWSNSVDRTGFRYRTMLSDGDSSAFRAVESAKAYGDSRLVTKLDCINHIHKRLGGALRKVAKDNKLGGRGEGRLTLQKCERLQNYFRGAILDKRNKTEVELRNAIWATYFHCVSTDADPHHSRCPAGPDSWCFVRKAEALGQQPGSHEENVGTFLARDVAEHLVPIYRRMSSPQLLKRIEHKKTQNANESLHSVLWSHLPKTRFFGKQRVEAAVANAVGRFNQGNNHITDVMNMFSMDINAFTKAIVAQQDKQRVKKAETATQAAFVAQRRRRRQQIDAERGQQEEEEGQVYGYGMLAGDSNNWVCSLEVVSARE